MGGAVSAGADNDELVDNLVEAEYIKTPMVERVFRAVDRGSYYAEGCKDNAYRDLAWKHGNLHLSSPCIYSEVMESLELTSGLSFLNIGSGTGYLSTMVGLILGPYGINHGVEVFGDVVDYARNKLEDFKNFSPAIDKYEFCPPQFVTGNCLLLDTSMHQYDRVYCGVTCPPEHENFMKNLIRVSGILVMPFNDQLLQVLRTGETTWECRNILPVTYGTLIPPSPDDAFNCVKLPEWVPLSLQEICRSQIRVVLRKNIDIENPQLKHKRKHQMKQNTHRFRRIVIPIFEESDSERLPSSNTDAVVDLVPENPSAGPYSARELAFHFEPPYQRLRRVSSQSPVTDPEQHLSPTRKIDVFTFQQDTRISDDTSDSDCEDVNRNKKRSTRYTDRYKHPGDICKHSPNNQEVVSEFVSSCSPNASHSDPFVREICVEDDGEMNNVSCSSAKTVPKRDTRRRHRPQIVWKHVGIEKTEKVDSDSEMESSSLNGEGNHSQDGGNEVDYTYLMKQKIILLPLPPPLKTFINFLRPL